MDKIRFTAVTLIVLLVAAEPSLSQNRLFSDTEADNAGKGSAISGTALAINIARIADYRTPTVDPFGVAQSAKRPRPGITKRGKLMALCGVLAIGAGAALIATAKTSEGAWIPDYSGYGQPPRYVSGAERTLAGRIAGGALVGAGVGLIWSGLKHRN